jgi:MFS family permease
VVRIFHVSTGLMALGIAPMLLVHHLGLGAFVLFVAGAASCPAMATSMLLVQDGVPATRRTEAMAWQSTAIWLGVAIGSSVSGHFADTNGSHAGYAVSALSGAFALAVATIGRRWVAPRRPEVFDPR